MTEPPDQRHYIQDILSRTGWTQTELAKRAGLDPSTLSRFLVRTDSAHALRPSTLKRIAHVSGIAFDDKKPDGAATSSGFAESEAQLLAQPLSTSITRAIAALGCGEPGTDAWVMRSRALELAGCRPDDILIVRLGETPLRGDIVCAQIYDWANNRAETVFRLFQPPYLVAASAEPALLAPIAIDGDKATIKGVVLHVLRNRSTT